MTSETKYRLALSTLMLLCGLLVARNVLGQAPVTIDVVPKVVLVNPYRTVTFRVRIRIPRDKDNGEFSYSATCGKEFIHSVKEVDREVYTYFENLVVLENCYFEVCLRKCFSQEVVAN